MYHQCSSQYNSFRILSAAFWARVIEEANSVIISGVWGVFCLFFHLFFFCLACLHIFLLSLLQPLEKIQLSSVLVQRVLAIRIKKCTDSSLYKLLLSLLTFKQSFTGHFYYQDGGKKKKKHLMCSSRLGNMTEIYHDT